MTFISFHALQALPASLVNRDDLGNTKTIHYGGTNRIRVSSQCWKRALRTTFRDTAPQLPWASRTKEFPALVAKEIVTTHHREKTMALYRMAEVMGALGLSTNEEKGTTNVMIFFPEDAVGAVAAVVNNHWDTWTKETPKDLKSEVMAAFDAHRAIDTALFGRMLAEIPGHNIEAASSASHPFSVDPARITADFFSAVDDRKAENETGSGMMGVTDLSAPVLYRHAAVNLTQLAKNLPEELHTTAMEGFAQAFIQSVPSGKQNSTAATTLPSVVVAVHSARDTSFADAFSQAIDSQDVLTDAVARLLDHTSKAAPFIPDATVRVLPLTADIPATEFQIVKTMQDLVAP